MKKDKTFEARSKRLGKLISAIRGAGSPEVKLERILFSFRKLFLELSIKKYWWYWIVTSNLKILKIIHSFAGFSGLGWAFFACLA